MNKNMVVDLDGPRNRERLCWQRPAANYYYSSLHGRVTCWILIGFRVLQGVTWRRVEYSDIKNLLWRLQDISPVSTRLLRLWIHKPSTSGKQSTQTYSHDQCLRVLHKNQFPYPLRQVGVTRDFFSLRSRTFYVTHENILDIDHKWLTGK
jgi:hypothetical protein